MNVFGIIVVALITVPLVRWAIEGGMIRAWVATILSFIPTTLAYGFFPESSTKLYVLPMIALFTVVIYKAVLTLILLARSAPVAAVNVPASDPRGHWAENA